MAERDPLDAIQEALAKAPERGFPETVEIVVNLKDLDLSLPQNRLEEEVPLPHGRGREVRVGVFGTPEMLERVKASADIRISATELDELAKDRKAVKKLVRSVDFFLAEAPLMPTIGRRLGVVLGPRGKMPKPVPPGSDPSPQIQALKRSVRIRTKGHRTFHAPVGSRRMPAEAIAQNVEALLGRLAGKLERGEGNIDSVYLKTTMGPAVRLR